MSYVYKLAKQRHDAKHKSFRNASQIVPEHRGNDFERQFKIEKEYMPHFLGLVGELAWSLYTGEPVDENIYSVRDGGEDFHGVEVKTITYSGDGEPELKIKVSEYESKRPEMYVLVKFDLSSKEVTILGTISRTAFDDKKVEKKYGRFLPKNYVVPLSVMESISKV
jgi:hypothetical protein